MLSNIIRPILRGIQSPVISRPGISVDFGVSTLLSSPTSIQANGIASATATWAPKRADGTPLSVIADNIIGDIGTVSAALGVVVASPGTIQDDGVDVAFISAQVFDTDGNPVVGMAASRIVIASSGAGNTITQPSGVTDSTGTIAASMKSTVSQAKIISATVAGTAITDTAAVTVSGSYVAPNVLVDLSFETNFDGATDGGAGAPTIVTRSTTRAFVGITSVRYVWTDNAADAGAAFYFSLGGNRDAAYLRYYFWLDAGWSITTVQKWARWRSGTGAGAYGGFYLDDGKGIAWGFDLEASAVTASLIEKANIPTNQWNYLECYYDRNLSAQPTVAVWFNGTPISKANGADPSGFGLTWLNGTLYAGARNSSDPMTLVQFVGTLNGGNTGSGTIYLDKIGVGTGGRIGP